MSQSVESEIGYSIRGTSPRAGVYYESIYIQIICKPNSRDRRLDRSGLSHGLYMNDFMQTAVALELIAVAEQQFALNTTGIFHYDNSNTVISISIQ